MPFPAKATADEATAAEAVAPEGPALPVSAGVLQRFYDSVPLMMGVVEPHRDDILHVTDNAATAAFFGTTPDALRGRLASELGVSASDRARWLRHYRQSKDTGESVTFRYAHDTPDRRFWLDATVSHLGPGPTGVDRYAYYAQDVTEQVAQHAVLVANEARQDALLHALPDLLFRLDRDGRYLDVHAPDPAALAAPADRLFGRTIHEVLPADLAHRLSLAITEALASNAVELVDYDFVTDDGERRYFEARVSPNTEHDEVLVVVRDQTERQRSRIKLRATASRLGSLIQSLQAAVLVEDEDGRVVLANQQFCDLFGVDAPPDALVGADCAEAVRSARALLRDPDAFARRIDATLEARERVLAEGVEFADGRVLERDYVPVELDGAYAGHLWLYRDVTEQRRAKQALRESKQLLNAIFNAADVGICVTDERGRFTRVNRGYCELYGYEEAALLAQSFTLVLPPEHRAAAQALHDAFIAGEPEASGEWEVMHRDGHRLSVIATAGLIEREDGGRLKVTTVTDISDRKRAERALAESEARFRALVEHSSDIITVLDGDGAFRHHNAPVERILGYSAEQWEGLSAFAHVHPDDRDRVLDAFRRIAAKQTALARVRFRFRHAEGHWLHLEATGTNRFEVPTIAGVVVNARDVTAQVRAEQALQSAEAKFRGMVEKSLVGTVIIQEGRFSYVNPRMAEIFGYTPEEMTALPSSLDIIHEEDQAVVRENLRRRLAGETEFVSYNVRGRRKDGATIHVELAGVADEYDGRLAVIGTARDVTAQVEAERLLQEREAQLALILEALPDALVFTDGERRIQTVNPAFTRLLGYPPEDVVGSTTRRLYAAPDALDHRAHERFHARGAVDLTPYAVQYRRKDGTTFTGETVGTPVLLESGQTGGFIGIIRDITERERQAHELARSEARYRLLAENMSDLVCLHAPDGTYEWVSPSVEGMLGYRPEELVGVDPYSLFHPDDIERIQRESHERLVRGEESDTSITYRIRHESGRWVWLETLTQAILDDDGEVERLQTASRDVSERQEMEERLFHQAHHDALTGLPNRTFFRGRLDAAVAEAEREGDYAVLFLDLDRFKTVNDSLGHTAGDHLLREVARRLLGEVRPCDTVARFGGDEFAVLLRRLPHAAHAEAVAQRIAEALRAPVRVDGRELVAGASIGVVTGRADHGSADALLLEADLAMYDAKKAGRGTSVTFSPAAREGIARQHRLEMDLRHAVEREELRAAYQPIVRLADGALIGFEALVRWQHPEFGLLYPDAFIDLAEESGQVARIDRWILAEACRQTAAWREAFDDRPLLVLNVNCSSRDLIEEGYSDHVRRILDDQRFSPDRLLLEITESLLVEDTERAAAELQRLRQRGVRFCIDDFGTGYSSLSTLHTLPIDTIKVDRSFVNEMEAGDRSGRLVETVVRLGRILEKSVVAEGIETRAQLDALRRMGCEFGQGYLFDRPLSLEAATDLIAADEYPWSGYWEDAPSPAAPR